MTEEKTAKLKLRRKKVAVGGTAQEPEIKLRPPPVVDARQSSAGSWLDEIDVTTAEWLWKQVLIGVSPDLRSVGWGVVPALPDFTHQVVQKEENTATEKFTIGDKSFEWFPLPAAHVSNTPEQAPATSLDGKHSQDIKQLKPNLSTPLISKTFENGQMVNLVSKENNQVYRNDPTSHSGEQKSFQKESLKTSPSLQTSSSSTVKETLASKNKNTKSLKAPQSSQKNSTNNVKEPPTSQKGSKKPTQERNVLQRAFTKNVTVGEAKLPPKQTAPLWPTVSFAKNTTQRSIQGNVSAQGQTSSTNNDVLMEDTIKEGHTNSDRVTEVTGSLENCPICLLQFPKQFTQLDMDSHLAQCLSETTVDVVW